MSDLLEAAAAGFPEHLIEARDALVLGELRAVEDGPVLGVFGQRIIEL